MSIRVVVGSMFNVLVVTLMLLQFGGDGSPCLQNDNVSGSGGSRVCGPGSDAVDLSAPPGTPAIDGGALDAGATEDWLGAVMARIETEEYNASVSASGLQAPNRAHNLRTYFADGGIEVVPRTGEAEDAWSFSWRTLGWGREGRLVDVTTVSVAPRVDGSRVSYDREGLEEWYENKKEGLEQGFTVMERPAGEGPLCIEGGVGSGLRAEFDSDEAGIDFLDRGGARVLRYAELHVREAGGREVPSCLRLKCNRVAILVDDAGAAYPLTVDPLMTSPAWTAESNKESAGFGYAVGTAGDVNGDGCSDVIVGAAYYDNDQVSEGRAYVYHGSTGGLAVSPAWIAEGNLAGSLFGYAVGTAGDVNGDGYSDVIIGTPGWDNGQTDEGRAYVYCGSVAGLAVSPGWTVESDQAGAALGRSVGTAGDVNGDGYSDVIVGAPYYSNGQMNEGRAFVYHGSAGGPAASPAWTA